MLGLIALVLVGLAWPALAMRAGTPRRLVRVLFWVALLASALLLTMLFRGVVGGIVV
jgi:hypothetical protein